MAKPLLDCLTKQLPSRRPLWLMRQAGRYLPEYQELRAQAGSFLNLCLTPALASEVTLQPLKRFDLDAAILFADILLVPMVMGQRLRFREGEGPLLDPVRTKEQLQALTAQGGRLAPVFETIDRVRTALPPHVAFLGFAGGLWTVACYMIEGQGKHGFAQALQKVAHEPLFLKLLFERLFETTLAYLEAQSEAGVEALQIFESHAGLLDEKGFRTWVIEPTQKLVVALKAKHPNIPIIGFPRGASLANKKAYFIETGVDALGLDQMTNLEEAQRELQPLGVLQGNLDPELLLAGGPALMSEAQNSMKAFGPHHIFNLGHGVLPQTPLAHITAFVEAVHNKGA